MILKTSMPNRQTFFFLNEIHCYDCGLCLCASCLVLFSLCSQASCGGRAWRPWTSGAPHTPAAHLVISASSNTVVLSTHCQIVSTWRCDFMTEPLELLFGGFLYLFVTLKLSSLTFAISSSFLEPVSSRAQAPQPLCRTAPDPSEDLPPLTH